ncbi:MAG: hypothetical protein GY807_07490 [Gammaproteobacteria bacterium]|nr:hypothetical protein [Gammaproteobacteria bacterium]
MSHREGRAEAPENTLAAFDRALNLGVNIEMDVRLSSDGVIVVIHDETIDCTTNGKGFVRDMTLEQIKRLDAGSHFSRSYKGERIPTLEEVFDLFIAQAPDNVIMSIDTHAESASMYEPLIELLQRYDLFERTFIEVTDTRVGDALRLRDNRVQLAVWAPSNREIDAAIDYPHYQQIKTRSRYAGRVGDVHNADKTLIAFVNSDGDIKTIRNFDIDGINTDRPEQMLSEFDD